MRLDCVISVITILSILGGCSNYVSKDARAELVCSSISPSSYYLINERQEDSQSRRGSLSSFRNFDPDKTSSAFSMECLKRWSDKGDPISDYIIFSRLAGSSNIYVLDDYVERINPEHFMWLERSIIRKKLCSNQDENLILFCNDGLPESYYVLGLSMSSENDYAKKRYLLQRSADLGLYIASQNILVQPKIREN